MATVGSASRVVAAKGQPIIVDQSLTKVATGPITPGYLVSYTSSGIALNGTANKQVGRTFALERTEMNKSIDDAYATGDQAAVGFFWPGQWVTAVIPSGTNVAVGDYLTPDAYGRLVAASSNPAIARAVEAVNNTNGNGNCLTASNGTGTDARIMVELV